MYVCKYVCLYVCMYVCIYIYIYVCIYIYVHSCVDVLSLEWLQPNCEQRVIWRGLRMCETQRGMPQLFYAFADAHIARLNLFKWMQNSQLVMLYWFAGRWKLLVAPRVANMKVKWEWMAIPETNLRISLKWDFLSRTRLSKSPKKKRMKVVAMAGLYYITIHHTHTHTHIIYIYTHVYYKYMFILSYHIFS